MTNLNTPERRREVRRKYEPLFWRHPNVYAVSLGRIQDENGNITNTWSITLRVTEKVDQATLSPEDRIPDCLEGIPIQILEEQPSPLAMGLPDKSHRPVLPGLQVKSATRDPATGALKKLGEGGTLTGPAWREDGKKVVLMCQHSVTGSIIANPKGGEIICQPTVSEANIIGTVPARTDANPSWHPTAPNGANFIDATYFIPSVGADFEPHKHPSHTVRRVLSGAVDPVDDDSDPMELLVVGAYGGEGTVTVTDVDYTWRSQVDNAFLTDTILLDVSKRPILGGDSGSPCLAHVTGNKYRMCGIIFAGGASIGHAFKATTAQKLLKITFGNAPPVAKARASAEQIRPGSPVFLDGSGSRDPEGSKLSFNWKQIGLLESPGAPQVKIKDNNRAYASFTAPDKIGALSFQLTVTDSEGEVDTATVNVTVKRADAGPDQTVYTGDKRVTLGPQGASASFFFLKPIYLWEQVGEEDMGGIAAKAASKGKLTLHNASGPNPWFEAPNAARELEFRLTLIDFKKGTDTDTVKVRVINKPKAEAGDAQTVDAGSAVTLDGSGSSGDKLTFKWEHKKAEASDPDVVLSGDTTAKPTFTAPSKAGILTFKLTVTDSKGTGVSDEVTVKVVASIPTTPPPPPTTITASSTTNSVTVTWNAVSGATGYVLQLGKMEEDEVVGYDDFPTTGLSYTVTNLHSITRYYYRVKSKNAAGEGSPSPVASLVTKIPTPKPTPPPPPTTITATSTANSVTVTWTAVSGATGYVLQLGKMEEDEVVGYDDFPTTGLSYTVTNLHSITRYYYKVKSKNAAGEGSPSPVASLVTKTPPPPPPPPPPAPKPTPPPAPTTITATSTANSVTVTWSAVTGATGYVLQLGKMEEDEVVGYDDFPTTGLSYTVTNLHSITRYYYKVKSKNAAGVGSPSPVASLVTKTPPPKPTPKPPPVTHVWSHSSYTGCGPGRKEIQACSNGHSRHTRTVSASDPLIWYDWEYTGRTHYDDADGKLYKEQRRTSHCGDTETRWVAS